MEATDYVSFIMSIMPYYCEPSGGQGGGSGGRLISPSTSSNLSQQIKSPKYPVPVEQQSSSGCCPPIGILTGFLTIITIISILLHISGLQKSTPMCLFQCHFTVNMIVFA